MREVTAREAAALLGVKTAPGFTKAAKKLRIEPTRRREDGYLLYARADVDRLIAARALDPMVKANQGKPKPTDRFPNDFFGEGGGGEKAVVYNAWLEGTLGRPSPFYGVETMPESYEAAWLALYDTEDASAAREPVAA